jgi:DNA processing protein
MKELLTLGISSIPGLKTTERQILLHTIETEKEFLAIKPIELSYRFNRRLKNTIWNPAQLLREAEQIQATLKKKTVQFLTVLDTCYPPQLKEIYDPPFLLFWKGKLPFWNETFLGIVGTRHPTGGGRTASFRFAKEAAEIGMVIVSGIARGIDGEAHRGALAGRGITLAVVAHGPDTVYPPSNRKIGEQILETGGAILSEYPPGTTPLPYHFPARNRIISGLSRGVVVVEAPIGSGALITAEYALEQGRDLFVHRIGMDSPRGEGTRRLVEEGAPLVNSREDLLKEWNHWDEHIDTRNKGHDTPIHFTGSSGKSVSPGKWWAHRLEGELHPLAQDRSGGNR